MWKVAVHLMQRYHYYATTLYFKIARGRSPARLPSVFIIVLQVLSFVDLPAQVV